MYYYYLFNSIFSLLTNGQLMDATHIMQDCRCCLQNLMSYLLCLHLFSIRLTLEKEKFG